MTRYIIRRFLLMIPTLLIVSMIVFSLIRLIPGDIAEIMVENRAGCRRMEGSVQMRIKPESRK